MTATSDTALRILIVDDQGSIHDDFRKILGGGAAASEDLAHARSAFFGEAEADTSASKPTGASFELAFAQQGDEGIEMCRRAKEAGVEKVAFDRSGYKYHGRVKALADAARETGLEF